MRIVFTLAFAAVAIFMAWTWYQPVCENGRVLASESECRVVAIFDADFCRNAWMRTDAIARTSGASYNSQSECSDAWMVCIERDPNGFAPRPSGWCLVRGPAGEALRIEPQYQRKRG